MKPNSKVKKSWKADFQKRWCHGPPSCLINNSECHKRDKNNRFNAGVCGADILFQPLVQQADGQKAVWHRSEEKIPLIIIPNLKPWSVSSNHWTSSVNNTKANVAEKDTLNIMYIFKRPGKSDILKKLTLLYKELSWYALRKIFPPAVQAWRVSIMSTYLDWHDSQSLLSCTFVDFLLNLTKSKSSTCL